MKGPGTPSGPLASSPAQLVTSSRFPCCPAAVTVQPSLPQEPGGALRREPALRERAAHQAGLAPSHGNLDVQGQVLAALLVGK